MAKPLYSSRQEEYSKRAGYKKALEDALDEYNEYLLNIRRKENNKYCIKCRSRKALEGLEFCKKCNGPNVDRIKPRMRRKIKKVILKKTKTNIKRNRSLKNQLKG